LDFSGDQLGGDVIEVKRLSCSRPPNNETQTCVAPNLLQRVDVAIKARFANFFNRTIGLGAGEPIGAGNKVGVFIIPFHAKS